MYVCVYIYIYIESVCGSAKIVSCSCRLTRSILLRLSEGRDSSKKLVKVPHETEKMECYSVMEAGRSADSAASFHGHDE